jgi:hypothetical protein
LPIVRFGNIALISDEFIPTTKFGDMEAYLIEARSIKGISGSPVFVLKPTDNGWRASLRGLMHGHWDLKPGAIIDADDGKSGGGSMNMGIAIVVPAKKY